MVEAEVSNVNSEAEKLIPYGWEFISTLPNNKIVLEKIRGHRCSRPGGFSDDIGSKNGFCML